MAEGGETSGCGKNLPCCVWWNDPDRSRYEKKLALIGCILLVVSISLVAASAVINNKFNSEKGVCQTKECVQSASVMMSNIDSSVDPCEDFYEFSCGNFQKSRVAQDDEYDVSTMSDMQNEIYIQLRKALEEPVSPSDSEVAVKTKNLYASCMNSSSEDGSTEELLKLIERVGRWPVIDSKWNEKDVDLERRLAILFVHGVFPFILPRVDEDFENTSDYLFNISSGCPILYSSFFLNDSNPYYQKRVKEYKKMFITTARRLNADEATINKDLEDMIEFEKQFANISQAKYWQDKLTSNKTESEEPRRCHIRDLNKLMPEFKWDDFFDYIFDYFNISLRKSRVTFIVMRESYLRNLTALLAKTSNRTLANYLTWNFVYNTMPYLDVPFRRLHRDFEKNAPFEGSFSRWKKCISEMETQFTMPLTALYVRDNFDTTQKDEILRLISSIKEEYKSGIREQSWLDDESKSMCERKVEGMRVKLGFPRYVTKPEELSKDFSELTISQDHFLQNILRVKRFFVAKRLSKLTGKTSREYDWLDDPLTVNAYYIPWENKMVFPLAQIGSPFFVAGRPNYLNFAGLGETVAHEITHAFDTDSFSMDANLKDSILVKYGKLAECFVEQYSLLPVGIRGINVNGNRTINDDLCDNASLKTAYKAYQTYVSEHGEEPALPGVPYSISQVFFIKYAQGWCEMPSETTNEQYLYDVHSPAKHRANVPMSNFEEFSKAFNCPKYAPMNPAKKCHLWG